MEVDDNQTLIMQYVYPWQNCVLYNQIGLDFLLTVTVFNLPQNHRLHNLYLHLRPCCGWFWST